MYYSDTEEIEKEKKVERKRRRQKKKSLKNSKKQQTGWHSIRLASSPTSHPASSF